jgi:hypothetical protein
MRSLYNASIVGQILFCILLISMVNQVNAETPIENKPKVEKTETNPCWYVELFTFDTIGAPKHNIVIPKKCEDQYV